MALKDILQAITDEADRQIAEAQTRHKTEMKEIKDSSEKTLTASLKHIHQQKEQWKLQMRQRAESHAEMVARHAVLGRKQELLDEVYAQVSDGLASLPKPELEKFLSLCMGKIRDKGTFHPAAAHADLVKKLAPAGCAVGETIPSKGGFRFVGEKQDVDLTFEFLVAEILRPATEIEVASELFAA